MEEWDEKEKQVEIIQKFIKNAMDTFTPMLHELLGTKYLSDEEREKLK